MIRRVLHLLGSLRITVIGLLLLLVLTVWGTLYQADHGLYLAQEKFYQSWWFLVWGVVPFPGAQLVMAVLIINLAASMILLALIHRWRWGLFVTHLGLLLMLVAGGVTFYLGSHAQLSLAEGEGSNAAVAFGDWEVALPPSGPDRKVTALDVRHLKPGRTIAIPESGLAMRVDAYYPNCEPSRETVGDPPQNRSGIMSLGRRPRSKEPADDRPGLVFTLLEDGRDAGRYLLWGGDPGPTVLRAGDGSRAIGLRYKRLPLPAMIQLIDFKREMHPGSSIAKSYSSQVIVHTPEGIERRVLVSMNKPLRIEGFTFYQSSFASGPGGEISTLAVVHNYGRMMPYVATGLTTVGMILHFTGMLVVRLGRRRAAGGAP